MHKFVLAALPLLAASLHAQGTPEAAEPNNTTATAAVLALGTQAYGNVTLGDADWFKVTITTPSDVRFWTSPGFGAQIGDSIVRVLAADGTTVLANVDDGNLTTHGFYSVGSLALAPGDYYFEVSGYLGTTIGTYTLDLAVQAPGTYVAAVPPLATTNEGPEGNDPRVAFGSGTATATTVFSQNLGFIAPPVSSAASGTSATTVGKDYDFYAVNLNAGGHTFRTTRSNQAAAPVINDTVLRLFDASFVSLAFNDDFGGAYSEINFNITTPGLYYICVSGYFGATSGTPSTGNYILDIFGPLPSLPTGPSTTTIQTGGCLGTAGTPALGTRLSTTGTNVRPERAVLGTSYWLDGTNLPASGVVVKITGLTTLPAPFDLTGLGAPGCQVEADPLAIDIGVADPAGVYFWSLGLPSGIALLGLPLEQQMAVVDLPANALGLTVSNRVSSLVGITH